MKATKVELESMLKDAEMQVSSLENSVDYHIDENNKLLETIDSLESEKEDLEEELNKYKSDSSLKSLKESLCDRYALNHLTNWETLILKLEEEAKTC